MALRYPLVVLLLGITCNTKPHSKRIESFGKRISFEATEFPVYCTRAIKAIDSEFHGLSFISNDGAVINRDSVNSALFQLSKYDAKSRAVYDTYLKNCDEFRFVTWVSNTSKNAITRIEKITLKTKIPLPDENNYELTITDFHVYSVHQPYRFAIRIINEDELEFLMIGEKKIRRVAESVPVGLDIATARLDSFIKVCQ